MNDPNYNDWADFYGEKISKNESLDKFYKECMDSLGEKRPAVIRNPGCKFTESVLDYLEFEWMVLLVNLPIELQSRSMDLIDVLKQLRCNVPNAAEKVVQLISQ